METRINYTFDGNRYEATFRNELTREQKSEFVAALFREKFFVPSKDSTGLQVAENAISGVMEPDFTNKMAMLVSIDEVNCIEGYEHMRDIFDIYEWVQAHRGNWLKQIGNFFYTHDEINEIYSYHQKEIEIQNAMKLVILMARDCIRDPEEWEKAENATSFIDLEHACPNIDTLIFEKYKCHIFDIIDTLEEIVERYLKDFNWEESPRNQLQEHLDYTIRELGNRANS